MEALDDPVVDGQDAVVEESCERDSMVVDVPKGRAEQRARWFEWAMRINPPEQLVVDRLGSSLPLRVALLVARGE
jgi:hypothetical protein